MIEHNNKDHYMVRFAMHAILLIWTLSKLIIFMMQIAS